MNLFKFEGDEIIVEPEIMEIAAFKAIWSRDPGYASEGKRHKPKARKELLYIWHMEFFGSPYFSYKDEVERADKVKTGIKLPEDWKEDSVVRLARIEYKKLSYTTELGTVISAYGALNKTKDYLENLDYTLLDRSGKPLHNPKVVLGTLKELDGAFAGLEKLKERVKKQKPVAAKIRGGKEIGLFEE